MKSSLQRKDLIVKKSPIHGYGVFANQNIDAGDIIEECYTLILPIDKNILINYVFGGNTHNALALGYGSIYNHSANPNARHHFDPDGAMVSIVARSPIKKGDEIYISYGDEWFSSRGLNPKEPSFKSKIKKLCASFFLILRFVLIVVMLMVIVHMLKFF